MIDVGAIALEVQTWLDTLLGRSNIYALRRDTNNQYSNWLEDLPNVTNPLVVVTVDRAEDANRGLAATARLVIQIAVMLPTNLADEIEPMQSIDALLKTIGEGLQAKASGWPSFDSFAWDGMAIEIDTAAENEIQQVIAESKNQAVAGLIRFGGYVNY